MSKGKRVRDALPPASAPFVPAELSDAALLQGGYEVAFFLGGDFVAHRVAVGALFEHWLTLLPPRTLSWAWIGPHTNRANRFAAKTIDRCKDQLTAKGAPGACFHIGGPEGRPPLRGASSYAFTVWAGDAEVRAFFPWSTPRDEVTRFVERAADTLDFTSGFATPSLRYDESADPNGFDEDGRRAWRAAMRLAVRHPGLEIHLPAIELDDRCHGAHWQTLLGPTVVARLGGCDAIRAAADAAALRVDGIARGVRIWASTSPEIGDSLAADVPLGLCRVASLLRDVTTLTSRWWPARRALDLLDDGEGPRFERFAAEVDASWQTRFLDGGRGLEPRALALDELDRLEHSLAEYAWLERLAGSMRVSTGGDWDELLARVARVPYWSHTLLDAAATLLAATWDRGEQHQAERLFAAFLTSEGTPLVRSKALFEPASSSELVRWIVSRVSSALEERERGRWLCALGMGVATHRPQQLGDVVSELPSTCELGALHDLIRASSLSISWPFQRGEFDTAARCADAAEPLARRFPATFSFEESETNSTKEGFRNVEASMARHEATLCACMASAFTKCLRFDDALRSLERAFQLAPDPTHLHNATYLFNELKEFALSVRVLRWWTNANKPLPDKVLTNAVNAYVATGCHEDAVQSAREGVQRRPTDPIAHWSLSYALQASGDLAGAVEAAKDTRKLDASTFRQLMSDPDMAQVAASLGGE